MTRLFVLFVIVLFSECTSLAQEPLDSRLPPVQAPFSQVGSLRGTVTSPDGAVVPGAQVTVRNTNTGVEKTVTTDDSGSFVVAGLAPGSYDVIVGSSGFSQKIVRNVQLTLSGATSVNIELNGNDVPISSPSGGGGSGGGSGGGKKPPPVINPNKPDESEPARGQNSPGPVNETKPISNTGSEVSEQSFKSDLVLLKWLDTKKDEKKRLATIVPITDQTSLFVFQKAPKGVRFQYSVFLIDQPLEPGDLSARIDQYGDKTFVGVHRLSAKSYLMVFYGK